MIIIFSLSGLLWGLLSLAVGVALFALTGRALPALVLPSIILAASGRLNRTFKNIPGLRARPSVFFIPLFVYGVAGLLFSIFLGYALVKRDLTPQDRRRLSLQADCAALGTGEAGTAPELAAAVAEGFAAGNRNAVESASWRVFARTNDEAVLVLARNIKLNSLSETEKSAALDDIERAIDSRQETAGKARYIALRGLALFGATRTPGAQTLRVSNDECLLPFYGKQAEFD